MAKDPAVLWYPNDWIGGTMGMTFEEKGAYMELLMMQFNRGHMSGHMVGQVVGQLWDNIKDKFQVDDQGLYYNARFEQEVQKRKSFVASRKNNITGANQYTGKSGHVTAHMGGHTSSHMENENENINEEVIVVQEGVKGERKIKAFTPPTVEQVAEYCRERQNSVNPKRWHDHYTSNGWRVGKNPMKDWKAAVRTWEGEKQPTKPGRFDALIKAGREASERERNNQSKCFDGIVLDEL